MTSILRSIELPNNLELPYLEQVDASGVPLVLLHAIADSWHTFEPLLSHLPTYIHAFALTQRGHGDASRPLRGYSVHDFAADLTAFMDAIHIGAAVIVAVPVAASLPGASRSIIPSEPWDSCSWARPPTLVTSQMRRGCGTRPYQRLRTD